MNTDAIVSSGVASATSRMAAATSRDWVSSAGTKIAMIASQASQSTSVRSVRP